MTRAVFNHHVMLAARLDLGLTQEEVAAALKVDIRTYRRYESGEVNQRCESFVIRHVSRRQLLQRISDELGVAQSDLVLRESPESV